MTHIPLLPSIDRQLTFALPSTAYGDSQVMKSHPDGSRFSRSILRPQPLLILSIFLALATFSIKRIDVSITARYPNIASVRNTTQDSQKTKPSSQVRISSNAHNEEIKPRNAFTEVKAITPRAIDESKYNAPPDNFAPANNKGQWDAGRGPSENHPKVVETLATPAHKFHESQFPRGRIHGLVRLQGLSFFAFHSKEAHRELAEISLLGRRSKDKAIGENHKATVAVVGVEHGKEVKHFVKELGYRVYAFEPLSVYLKPLKEWISAEGLEDRVELVSAAAGEMEGSVNIS
eukprot:Plantae.Rhodophyta-Hildenbrandia_rubra.ctg40964.p1 GENE.Plantae.Rhodophyta-Hildenbrandia_rubra.ctg40964~~Plantae.Rhodophyta-Hildenbrandia_rubra.ctg40964.p1  ORF type:complete len:290 (+),score=36.91 Plantae.Rhodophyta-Hildenbrandia_rubra.ctg40964:209-1078(+)